ncbi:MAG: TraR/DksA C4-type zinc finger protein [Acidimicrobiales bacterium]
MSEHTDDEAASLSQIEKRLDGIDAALRRLDDGTYASCRSCGRAIADERLGAEPTEQWCEHCQPRTAEGGG